MVNSPWGNELRGAWSTRPDRGILVTSPQCDSEVSLGRGAGHPLRGILENIWPANRKDDQATPPIDSGQSWVYILS